MNGANSHAAIERMLSAYLDEQLTQAETQRVELHLEECASCRAALAQMREIQRLTAQIPFRRPSEEDLEALEHRLSVRAPRRGGWALLLAGVAAWILYGLVALLRHPRWPSVAELIAAAVVIGLLLLFISVLRQRLLERPHDRYRRIKR